MRGLYDEDGIDGPFERLMGGVVAVHRLPTKARSSVGMETVCDDCGEPITDEFFYAGFVAERSHVKLHDGCLTGIRTSARTPDLLANEEGK